MIQIKKYIVMALAMVAFAGCSEEETSQNTNNNVPENAVKVGYVNNEGDIVLTLNQADVISRFNEVVEGYELKFIDIRDDAPMNPNSTADLVIRISNTSTKMAGNGVFEKNLLKTMVNGTMTYYYLRNMNKVASGDTHIVWCSLQGCDKCPSPNTDTQGRRYCGDCLSPVGKGRCDINHIVVPDNAILY
ncbi:MAG: hypothetical protein LBR17_00420 [Bacteroidales bacterium]|jgi:hypothetical protein|nr:hypothetical protein [Bacteroidales bacterium]